MTKIDNLLVRTGVFIVTVAFILALCFSFSETLKLISFIGSVLFFFFIMSHLALCAPLFIIVMYSKDILDRSLFSKIESKSVIIYYLIVIIFTTFNLFTIYIIIPLLLAMLYNNSVDIHIAINSVKTVIT